MLKHILRLRGAISIAALLADRLADMSRTPSRDCIWIDVDMHDGVSASWALWEFKSSFCVLQDCQEVLAIR